MSVANGRIAEAAAALRARGITGPFACAIVLGTGLGELAEEVGDPLAVPYGDIPGFPETGVSSHRGQVIAGDLEGRRILVLSGRVHAYETGDPAAMRVPVGTASALGAPILLLTNAAGGVRSGLGPGTIALLTDHISLSGLNPLVGETGDARFVPMTDAYDPDLRRMMLKAAFGSRIDLEEGVYMWFPGPSFETPAEIRTARALGADLVGMSTVPEVILARFFGLRVAALSLVTNAAAGLAAGPHTHADTQAAGRSGAPALRRLVRAFVAALPEPGLPEPGKPGSAA